MNKPQEQIVSEYMSDKHCIYFVCKDNWSFVAIIDMVDPTPFFDYLFDIGIVPEIKPLSFYQEVIRNQERLSEQEKQDGYMPIMSHFNNQTRPLHIDDDNFSIEEFKLLFE